jgi:hypothetical protein
MKEAAALCQFRQSELLTGYLAVGATEFTSARFYENEAHGLVALWAGRWRGILGHVTPHAGSGPGADDRAEGRSAEYEGEQAIAKEHKAGKGHCEEALGREFITHKTTSAFPREINWRALRSPRCVPTYPPFSERRYLPAVLSQKS